MIPHYDSSMSDLERRIRAEQERLQAAEAEERAWHECAFSRTDVVVGQPQGDFEDLVEEVIGIIPRKMWRKALIGKDPQGLTRVTWSIARPSDGDLGAGSRVLRLRKAGTSKCLLFLVTFPAGPDDRGFSFEGHFAVTKEGFASYSGDLAAVRQAVVKSIALGQMSR